MRKTLFCLLAVSIFCVTSLHAQDTGSDEYIIEKFDTLWGISDTRLEDPFLWPKLWNVNPHIENPDLIYPGSKIRIPSREELMRMPAYQRKGIPSTKASTKEKKIDTSEPRSVWKFAPTTGKKHIIGWELYIASGWIADEYPGIGEITYSPMDRQIVSKDDTVYIKSDSDDIMDGKRFFVIRDIKMVRHPVSNNKIGHQIRIVGILEVIGKDNNMTKAKVINSFEAVQLGDGLLPYKELEPPFITDSIRTPDVSGYIIESHMSSYLLVEGNVIFLDKGENDGVKVGDVFSVLSEQPTESHLGTIQIVSLQPTTSGAVLLQSSQELTVGSKWGQKTK
jgi:hypothetical protein